MIQVSKSVIKVFLAEILLEYKMVKKLRLHSGILGDRDTVKNLLIIVTVMTCKQFFNLTTRGREVYLFIRPFVASDFSLPFFSRWFSCPAAFL